MRRQIASQSFVAAMPRPAAPSRRASRADMSRMGFIWLVTGWWSAFLLALFVSALIRFVG